MTKHQLISIIKGLLEVGEDVDLGFLLKLDVRELEVLVACVRDRVDCYETQ